jgi:hypothetical protein
MAESYYVKHGMGHDALLRCKDCRKLVSFELLQKLGNCTCGNRRVVEIRTLSEEEFADIQSGRIDFPHREEFLAEFAGVDVDGL